LLLTFCMELHTFVCMGREKSFTSKEIAAIQHIRNWVAHRGRTPSVRELMTDLGYKSPRSVQDVLEKLLVKGVIKKHAKGDYQLMLDPDFGHSHAQTVKVPIVGTIAAGSPVFAEENIETYVPISTSIAKPGSKYFLLHVVGDSMNRVHIYDGDLILIRQQPTAEEGEKVVALIDDEATVKEFHHGNGLIILKPRSTNKKHKPIILTEDFQIQGVVIATVPKLL
jgi:repressor LexA